MSLIEERVKHLFGTSIETNIAVAELLSERIAKAASLLINCLLSDRKIVLCGNGGSAANCLHFSAALLHLYEVDRPALPVITLNADTPALTAIAQDSHYDRVFARQIHALGKEGDILILLSTTGNGISMLKAINAAHERGMVNIVLSGKDGGELAKHLHGNDIELRVCSDKAARIRESHLFILHCFCDAIDQSLFGEMLE